jgi:hypothetical protein
VIVTLDTLAVSAGFATPLRQALAQMADTTPDAVWMCASHTHCGPCGLQDWFPFSENPTLDPHLMQTVCGQLLAAAKTALDCLAPVRLWSAWGEVQGVGGDRNQPDAPVDSRVTALRFDRPNGEVMAIIFHYACHPTVLGAQTRLHSADWPGAARRQIRSRYQNAVCLYLNGAAGNISTRFFRRESSFQEVTRLGTQVGDCVLALLKKAAIMPGDLDYASYQIDLPFRAFPPARSLESTGQTRIDTTRAEGATLERQLAQVFAGRATQHAQIVTLQLGSWKLLGVPGEAFSDLALAVRMRSDNALVVGYTNDYLGYFPTRTAVDQATYEALSSPYDHRAHERLEQYLTALLT